MTFSLPRSGLISSIIPLKSTNGPSITRTLSPFWKTDLGFGFSAPSSIWCRIASTSSRGSGDGRVARADEPGHLRRRLDEVPGVVGHLHLDEHVAREELLRRDPLLPLANLDDLLGRNHDLADRLFLAEDLGPLADRLRHLVLEPRVRVHDVPVSGHAHLTPEDQSDDPRQGVVHAPPGTRPGRRP